MSDTTFELNSVTALQANQGGNIPALNYQAALASYTPDEQKEITELADKIDVLEDQKVMAYGAQPLISSFENVGKLLKEEQGSEADQRVMNEVRELSNMVNEKFEDFNLIIKKPGFLEKLFLSLSSEKKKQRNKKIHEAAITSYKLLMQLNSSYDSWLDMLREAMFQITSLSVSERMNTETLEKYIVAGYMACDKIEQLLVEKKEQYEQSGGLVKYEQEYEDLKDGYELFQRTLENLESSRFTNKLAIGELKLSERNNRRIQESVNAQKKHGMLVLAQQLGIAVLDAKNREVLEASQSVMRLTEELMKKVANNVALTAQESKQLVMIGFYSFSALQESLNTILNAFEEEKKGNEEIKAKKRAEIIEGRKKLEQLDAYISEVKQKNPQIAAATTQTSKTTSSSTSSTSSVTSGTLQF